MIGMKKPINQNQTNPAALTTEEIDDDTPITPLSTIGTANVSTLKPDSMSDPLVRDTDSTSPSLQARSPHSVLEHADTYIH